MNTVKIFPADLGDWWFESLQLLVWKFCVVLLAVLGLFFSQPRPQSHSITMPFSNNPWKTNSSWKLTYVSLNGETSAKLVCIHSNLIFFFLRILPNFNGLVCCLQVFDNWTMLPETNRYVVLDSAVDNSCAVSHMLCINCCQNWTENELAIGMSGEL